MKFSVTALVLLVALLAFIPGAQGSAQTLPAPTPAVASAPAVSPVPADTADFLVTLSAAPASAANDLAPAPAFMTGCTTNAQCPPGTLCCYPCGIDGCTNMCITPLKGHCPHFP